MKAVTYILIIMMSAAFLCSCASRNMQTPADNDVSDIPSDTASSSGIAITEDEDISTSDGTVETAENTSYIGALSEKQKQEILDFADEWYKENFSEYKVLSMDFAEDDNAGYTYYSDLKPGEIIILQVHTTHGSKKKADGTIDGIPRDFFVKITESGYEFLNEGY